PAGAVVQSPIWPGELITFGLDAAALWDIARRLAGWRVLQVDRAASGELVQLMTGNTDGPARTYDEVYH
ncbi:MAG: hypothetical protein GTN78_00015, partial [Gemmatimonadales bacterium]|nr:hypothetical protein [Gemmatimonadales bacterium]